MKALRKSYRLVLTLGTAVLLMSAIVPDRNTYTLDKEYTVWFKGTSNLHDWDEKVGSVSGAAVTNANRDGSIDLNEVSIIMAVRSIKSDMGAVMNSNTYKALKADLYPEISFRLRTPVKGIQPGPASKTISASGDLTIAGVTKSVDMQVTVYMKESGKIAFEGSQSVKMSDFGIDPPTALFGTLKTGNEITISFKISFSSAPETSGNNNGFPRTLNFKLETLN